MKTKRLFNSMNQLSSWFVLAVLILSALLIPAGPAAAAAVTEEWVARYNGPGNYVDSARAIAVDKDGNVYMTGASFGSGTSTDYATIKYDPNGNELWVARYNGPANFDDNAAAIAVDKYGNVYVTGYSTGLGTCIFNLCYDYATIKYDPNGNELWVARYNGPGNYVDSARAIAVDASGNVYVTGYSEGSGSSYDYATVKYDPNGNQLWVARYNGPGNYVDYATAIAVDASGNVYVTGQISDSTTAATRDYATIKYDPNGNQLWVARYDAGPVDVAQAIALDASGNIYVTGSSAGSETGFDYATVKYDPSGNQLWATRYNGPGNGYDQAYAIAVDASGNVYVTGYSTGSDTGRDYATIKYDTNGNQLWGARYTGPGNAYDQANAIAVDASGNVYVTGYSPGSGTDDDYATIKYDPNGHELWVARYNGPGNFRDDAYAVALDASGNVYVTGFSYGSGTSADYATIKYKQASAFDFAGLTQLLDSLLADGAIATELRTSLLAKVKNAQSSYDGGDVCTAVSQLNALKNQIKAQSGKKITSEAAEQLLAYINDLATQLLSTLPAGGSC